jgi:DNA-directed RNA polymerase subunit RPC12/RpoP
MRHLQSCAAFFLVIKVRNAMDSKAVSLQTFGSCGVPRGDAMPTFRAPAQLSRATPVICPECGGRAPLIRMSPDSFTRGKTEIWTYECAACGHKVEKTVETGATPS